MSSTTEHVTYTEIAPGESLKARPGALKRTSDFPPPVREPQLEIQAPPAEISVLERIIDESNLLPAAFLEEGALRQRAVARLPKISSTNPLGTAWGSGFLVSNSLIMTNNHVIGSVAEAKTIMVQFNYQVDYRNLAQPIDTWSLDPDKFFYTNAALDFTLVRVKGKPLLLSAGQEMQFAAEEALSVGPGFLAPLLRYPGSKWGYLQLPATANYLAGDFLNVVQHPAGRMKEVALQKNQLTDIFTDRIHYTTDTEGGSSGSPVFNNLWDLVALHHAAGTWDSVNSKWIDNEGMRIDSIVSKVKAQFSASNPALLTELGI
jgi:endonuclease G, mitochondrial